MGNELFQARLPDDFAEEVHEYREENHMSKSEAVRHLLRVGLKAEDDDTDNDHSHFLEQLAQDRVFIPATLIGLIGILLVFPSIILLSTGDVLLASVGFTFSVLLTLGGILTAYLCLFAQLALARPIRGLVGVSSEVKT